MPPEGTTAEPIAFSLILDEAGKLVSVADMRDSRGRARRLFVPARAQRSSNVLSNFLWDNTGYVLGVDGKGKAAQTRKTAAAFREFHQRLLRGCGDVHARALLAFLDWWTPDRFASLESREALLDSNVVFQLMGETVFFHDVPALREIWAAARDAGCKEEKSDGICLITGKRGTIARTHPFVRGVAGAQSSGASLVSFNFPALESYGKEQSLNAPVSTQAAEKYVCALNYLLSREHRQTVRIADTSIVFWADAPSPEESALGDLFDLASPKESAQDREQVERLKSILLALRRGNDLNGADASLSLGARFFVLGLAPNAARLSVRFWLSSTLKVLLRQCGRWYGDLSIERQFPDSEPEFPPLWRLLEGTVAIPGRQKTVPPELGGQLSRAMLTGGRIPESVFVAVLGRIRADDDKTRETRKITYFRMALIKAYLRRNTHEEKDMTTLNADERNTGYRLGRVFALLEKAQSDALGKNVNASLRERYIGAASATPRLVFPMLLRLAQHHVSKARKTGFAGYDVLFSQRLGEVLADLTDFPAVLSLEDQGRFMLGYYHQLNDLYRKKDADQDAAGENKGE